MDFEKVKEIIVETLSCDADKVTPEAVSYTHLGTGAPKREWWEQQGSNL